MSVLIVGSIGLDTIKTPLGSCSKVLGGSASYASLSASCFTNANMVAVVGADFPSDYIKLLKSKNVNLKGVTIEKGRTFQWKGEYGWDLNAKTLETHLNVFADFDPQLPKEYCNAKYVFLANIDPIIQEKVLKQVKKPKLVICDTMNYWIERKKKDLLRLVKKTDIFLLNESEARQLSGEVNLVKAAKAIQRLGAHNIIIKKGEHGALLFWGNKVFSTPAVLLEEIFDPTGAGDTFAGGIIGYMAGRQSADMTSLRQAIVYGSIMASFAVEDFSVKRLAKISKRDIVKRYKEFQKQTYF